MDAEAGRRKSPVHEARWLNLLGFGLRPGYGLAVDDWRVAETWRLVQGKLVHPSAAVRLEGWILWRRIGGGLLAGQQQALAEPLLGPIRGLHRLIVGGKGRGGDFGFQPNETAEIWRLLGSFELLPVPLKVELGDILLDLLPKRKMETVRTGDRLGRRPPGRAGAALWAAEHRRARRDGRGVAEAADRFLRRRSGRAAGRDADRPQDRRSLPRSLAKAARIWPRPISGRRTPRAISSHSCKAAAVSTARSKG